MIKGTIKDYTITTLEELIEHKVPRDNKELKVYIHTYLNLRITGLKWDNKYDDNNTPLPNKKYNKEKLYIRYLNILGKEIYKPIRSQFTKQTLWEIVKYLYSQYPKQKKIHNIPIDTQQIYNENQQDPQYPGDPISVYIIHIPPPPQTKKHINKNNTPVHIYIQPNILINIYNTKYK